MKVFLIILVLVIGGVGSGFAFKMLIEPRLFTQQAKSQVPQEESPPDTSGFAPQPTVVISQPVVTVSPATSSATLAIATKPDKKALLLTFQNLEKVLTIDYEVHYVAGGIAKGITGHIVRLSEPSIVREIVLGTCSQGVCTYDTGVKSVDVSATFTLEDKKTLKVEKTHLL